ncbi:hypothetical protein [Halobaculum rubrum]|uniref:hypothetical protein n=1 Tax=Halobaculum rubrum TaxID=2872158 RepID=UPI001CA45110|nr:hypothetical protein [Halobaculum rubrum]QZX98344.1 hypothetical protein K6T25_08545 [Halobaculum rubrum]
MSEPTDLSDVDERVLRHLDGSSVDYPALVAANTGLHIPLVERRLATLAERGFVEAVTDEQIFRITEHGRRALSEKPAASTAADATPTRETAAPDGGSPVDTD